MCAGVIFNYKVFYLCHFRSSIVCSVFIECIMYNTFILSIV